VSTYKLNTAVGGDGLAVRRNEPFSSGAMPFLVVAMHTASHSDRADRLLASCRTAGLAATLQEVPAVHRSISPSGSSDMTLTKASFIRRAIEAHGRPVLYVDVDIVFRERPARLETFAASSDFAIYNWLADAWNDAWLPMPVRTEAGESFVKRFWKFSHAVDAFDPGQLVCSGAVQLWGPSVAALDLLDAWQRTIAAHPGVADDECLDFAFNNRDNGALRPTWLDKSHVRYPWWPHVRPVIDHPDPVGGSSAALKHMPERNGRKRFYPERARRPAPLPNAFPRWAILDVEQACLLRIVNDAFVPVARVPEPFWPS
jgi:hypothetical protein